MELTVVKQNEYSRTQLIVRSLFGWLYILIPHIVLLIIVEFYALFMHIYNTFYILLKGEFPKKGHAFFNNFFHWASRLHLRAYNLNDGYPAIGLHCRDEYLQLEIKRPERVDRLHTLFRFALGPVYILIPHLPVILLRFALCVVLAIPAFFAVLFTAKYPRSLLNFQIRSLHYAIRVYLYFFHLYPHYPPFHGKPDQS